MLSRLDHHRTPQIPNVRIELSTALGLWLLTSGANEQAEKRPRARNQYVSCVMSKIDQKGQFLGSETYVFHLPGAF